MLPLARRSATFRPLISKQIHSLSVNGLFPNESRAWGSTSARLPSESIATVIEKVDRFIRYSDNSVLMPRSRAAATGTVICKTEVGLHTSVFDLVEAFEMADHSNRHDFVNNLVSSLHLLSSQAVKTLFETAVLVHPHGVKFATSVRAICTTTPSPTFDALSKTLEPLLTLWYGAGFLELREIDWDSPGRTLEWIAKHENVHPTDQLGRFRQRFEGHLLCFGLFHSCESWKPVSFVHAAITHKPANSLGSIWSSPGKELPSKAVFYSISGSHPGLKGIGVPRQLLYRVKHHLQASYPSLQRYLTLSPIPLFSRWLYDQISKNTVDVSSLTPILNALSVTDRLKQLSAADLEVHRGLLEPFLRGAVTRYLTQSPSERVVCPVSRFHLGNGAQIAEIHYAANPGNKGLAESFGMMVNYEYCGAIDSKRVDYSSGIVHKANSVE